MINNCAGASRRCGGVDVCVWRWECGGVYLHVCVGVVEVEVCV